jgi:hypothetical protein
VHQTLHHGVGQLGVGACTAIIRVREKEGSTIRATANIRVRKKTTIPFSQTLAEVATLYPEKSSLWFLPTTSSTLARNCSRVVVV